jgi:hypothetical protein
MVDELVEKEGLASRSEAVRRVVVRSIGSIGPFFLRGGLGLPLEIRSIQRAQQVIETLSAETRQRLHWRIAEVALGRAHISKEAAAHATLAFQNALETEGWAAISE